MIARTSASFDGDQSPGSYSTTARSALKKIAREWED